MKITYENHGDYYIFSHEPNIRVYLGKANPEDYIHDELEQVLRSNSGYYFKISNGQKVDELPDGEILGHNYDYECSYSFKRKLSLAEMGNFSTKTGAKFVQGDKAMERLAWIYFLNTTPELYDARQEERRIERDKQARENPYIHNLCMVWEEGVGNVTYYVDDDGNRITSEEHQQNMKSRYGDDVFDIADSKVDPEIRKSVEKILKMREAMKGMNHDDGLEYLRTFKLDDFE